MIIAIIVALHVVSSGLRGIAWLDLFNGLFILGSLVAYGFMIIGAAEGLAGVMDGLGTIRERFLTIPGIGVLTLLPTSTVSLLV